MKSEKIPISSSKDILNDTQSIKSEKSSHSHIRLPSVLTEHSNVSHNKLAIATSIPRCSTAPSVSNKNYTNAPKLNSKKFSKIRHKFKKQSLISISKLRISDSQLINAKNLRYGNFEVVQNNLEASAEMSLNQRKGWSHHHQSPDKIRQSSMQSISSQRDKGQHYGNKAQEFDGIQRDLEYLQKTLLGELKTIVNCEIANILFVNDATNELLLYANKRWFRVPIMSSIAGACYIANDVVYVPDAYADTRFNSNVDLATGFRTRNILCQPVRLNHGTGNVMAVVQMLNKGTVNEPLQFDDMDVDALASYVEKIADKLNSQFKELLGAAERLSANAMGERMTNAALLHRAYHRYDSNTENFLQRISSSVIVEEYGNNKESSSNAASCGDGGRPIFLPPPAEGVVTIHRKWRPSDEIAELPHRPNTSAGTGISRSTSSPLTPMTATLNKGATSSTSPTTNGSGGSPNANAATTATTMNPGNMSPGRVHYSNQNTRVLMPLISAKLKANETRKLKK